MTARMVASLFKRAEDAEIFMIKPMHLWWDRHRSA